MKQLKIVLLALVAFFNANVLFTQTYNQDADEVDFYVPGILANDAMESVNFLICEVLRSFFELPKYEDTLFFKFLAFPI